MDKAKVKNKASDIKLIAFDLDGTSLDGKGVCTPRTLKAFQTLIDRRYLIVPDTGRKYPDLMEKILPVIGVKYAISANGAMITECESGKRLWEKLIPNDLAARFVDEVFVPGNSIYFFCGDEDCTRIRGCTSREFYEEHFSNPLYPITGDFVTERLGDKVREQDCDIAKIGLWFTRPDGFEYYEDMAAEEYPELNTFRSAKNELEFTSDDTDKGTALKFLTEYLNLKPEEVCAVGDNGNDVSMLKYAGLGLAMGNGTDEAKNAADIVIGSNDEEGLAEFIEEFFL